MSFPTSFDGERRAPRLVPLGTLLFLAGASWGNTVGFALAALGLLAVLLACYAPGTGLRLVGPLAVAELKRAARRGRPWFWRVVYAAAGGAIVAVHFDRIGLPDANSLMLWFTFSLVGYVAVLTVQLVAPMIAEERDGKRWDILRTTDLHPRELLLGKFFGRFPVILDPLVAVLPILAVLPVLGGVPAWFPLALGVSCLAVTLGLGSLAACCSVFSKTPGEAKFGTMLLAGIYLVFSGLLWILEAFPVIWNFPSSLGVRAPVDFSDVAIALNAGNPLTLFHSLRASEPDAEVLHFVRNFAIFHFATFVIFTAVAARRLPRAELWMPARAKPVKKGRKPKPVPERPRVGDWPIVWWERYRWLNSTQTKVVKLFEWRKLKRVFIGACVLSVLIRVFDLVYAEADNGSGMWLTRIVLPFAFLGGGIALCPPIFRAARSIARERAADTLEGLLLTDLDPREIVRQKWLGSVLGDVPLVGSLIAVVGPATLAGAIPFWVGFTFCIALPVSLGFLAAVGVWLGSLAKTQARGAMYAMIFLTTAYFALSTLAGAADSLGSQVQAKRTGEYSLAAMLPASTPVILVNDYDRRHPDANSLPALLGCWCLGIAVYAGLAWLALRAAARRLERERGPLPVRVTPA